MARSKYEKRAQKTLEEAGYEVDWKIRPSRPSPYYNTDYFNIFDLLAYKPGELRLISVKSASNALTSHQEEIIGFEAPKSIQKELWRFDRDPNDKRKIRCRIWLFEDGERKEIPNPDSNT